METLNINGSKKQRNGLWTDANQTNNQINYQPENLFDSTFYRRIVISNNIKDTSNIILINIKNSWGGIINSTNDTIVEGNSTGNFEINKSYWHNKKLGKKV